MKATGRIGVYLLCSLWLFIVEEIIGNRHEVQAATSSTHLYEIRIPSDINEAVSESDLGAAFHQMLLQVSGWKSLPPTPLFEEALITPDDYLMEQRYEIGLQGQEVVFVFNRIQIDKLIQQGNLRREREAHLVTLGWFVFETDGIYSFIDSNSAAEMVNTLVSAANNQGVSLILPPLDDQIKHRSIVKVWSGDISDLISIAVNYRPETSLPIDAFLLARATRVEGKGWEVRWTLTQEEQKSVWKNSGKPLSVALTNGIQATATRLNAPGAMAAKKSLSVTQPPPLSPHESSPSAGPLSANVSTTDKVSPKFSLPSEAIVRRIPNSSRAASSTLPPSITPELPPTGIQGSFDIEIAGIGLFTDYVRVENYLFSLPMVKSVRLRHLNSLVVVLSLNAEGGLSALVNAIVSEETLLAKNIQVDNRFHFLR